METVTLLSFLESYSPSFSPWLLYLHLCWWHFSLHFSSHHHVFLIIFPPHYYSTEIVFASSFPHFSPKCPTPISGVTFSYPFSISCSLLFLIIPITCNTGYLKKNTFYLNFSFWYLRLSLSASFQSIEKPDEYFYSTNVFFALSAHVLR